MMRYIFVFLLSLFSQNSFGSYVLIPMDNSQKNHLKAYGIIYKAISNKNEVNYLVNFRGGSFLIYQTNSLLEDCLNRNITFECKNKTESDQILKDANQIDENKISVQLSKLPRIAFYESVGYARRPDVVGELFKYAELPFTIISETEIIKEGIKDFDWIYVQHEDFTGQYDRLYSGYKNADWYKEMVSKNEKAANNLGFNKVSQMKLAVAKEIKKFIRNGGFLYAMCSSTDSYDIALAAEGVDICAEMFDGDKQDEDASKKLNYSNCLAFKNFKLSYNPYEYEFSSIDTYQTRGQKGVSKANDYFTLNKELKITEKLMECMAMQNHQDTIKGFWGTTTGFNSEFIKDSISFLASNPCNNEVRLLLGNFGKGFFTFYSGHDPEDYQSRIEDPVIKMSEFSNSPGYRIILNNLFLNTSNYPKLSSEKEISENFSISVFSNPTSNEFTLGIKQSSPQEVTIFITDINGKEVKFITKKEIQKEEQIKVSLSGLSSGIYFVTARNQGESVTQKIIKSDK